MLSKLSKGEILKAHTGIKLDNRINGISKWCRGNFQEAGFHYQYIDHFI